MAGAAQQHVGLPQNQVTNKMAFWSKLVTLLSFEWILTRFRRPNGGDIILLRALLIALLIYLSVIGVKNLLDPERGFSYDGEELRKQIGATLHWFGALVGSIYAALYTRFASQWRYLANLYNKIKEAEAKYGDTVSNDVICSWKAGFLEDAEDLHLAKKQLFVSVINAWGKDSKVRQAFIENSPGGKARFNTLMREVVEAYNRYDKLLGNSQEGQTAASLESHPTNRSRRRAKAARP